MKQVALKRLRTIMPYQNFAHSFIPTNVLDGRDFAI